MGESQGWLFEPTFNRSIKLQRGDARITSDAGALLLREADHRLGLIADLAARLAHELGLGRGTVRKYVHETYGPGAVGGVSKPATIALTGSPPGFPDQGSPKPASIALTGSGGSGGSGGLEEASEAGGPPHGSVETTAVVAKPGSPFEGPPRRPG